MVIFLLACARHRISPSQGHLLVDVADKGLCFFNCAYSTSLAICSTSSSTSSSLKSMPCSLSLCLMRERRSAPFSGAKSNAAAQPTTAPPKNAYKIPMFFIYSISLYVFMRKSQIGVLPKLKFGGWFIRLPLFQKQVHRSDFSSG